MITGLFFYLLFSNAIPYLLEPKMNLHFEQINLLFLFFPEGSGGGEIRVLKSDCELVQNKAPHLGQSARCVIRTLFQSNYITRAKEEGSTNHNPLELEDPKIRKTFALNPKSGQK